MDNKIEKWERWLEITRKEVMDLVRSKHIFWQLGDIVKNNPEIQNRIRFISLSEKPILRTP